MSAPPSTELWDQYMVAPTADNLNLYKAERLREIIAAKETHSQAKIVLFKEAADFFGMPEETTRADLTRSFMNYCTEHGLLDADGETIHLNKELLELLDLDSREWVNTLNLERFLRALYNIPGEEPSNFRTTVLLSDKLATFLGLPSGSKLSRSEIARAICAYCETHKLMGSDRSGVLITADAALKELLGLQPGDFLSILNLQRYLRDLYYKL